MGQHYPSIMHCVNFSFYWRCLLCLHIETTGKFPTSCDSRLWLSQQTRGAGPMLGWCWPIVCDAGPTSAQHWANASCLLGCAHTDVVIQTLTRTHWLGRSKQSCPLSVYRGGDIISHVFTTCNNFYQYYLLFCRTHNEVTKKYCDRFVQWNYRQILRWGKDIWNPTRTRIETIKYPPRNPSLSW